MCCAELSCPGRTLFSQVSLDILVSQNENLHSERHVDITIPPDLSAATTSPHCPHPPHRIRGKAYPFTEICLPPCTLPGYGVSPGKNSRTVPWKEAVCPSGATIKCKDVLECWRTNNWRKLPPRVEHQTSRASTFHL